MGKSRSGKFTQTGFNKAMRRRHNVQHGQYTGYHAREVQLALPRSYAQDRTRQFLTHFATALKEWVNGFSTTTAVEIQLAVVNDAFLFISSNKNEAVLAIYDEFCRRVSADFVKQQDPRDDADLTRPLTEALTAMTQQAQAFARVSGRSDRTRRLRHLRKFHKELSGAREAALTFEGLAHELCEVIDADDACGGQVKDFIYGDGGSTQVMLITSSRALHAEQKILTALTKAMKGDANAAVTSIVFAGTFRPCRGCYESLHLVKRFLFPEMSFGTRPGHFWKTTTPAHGNLLSLLFAGGTPPPSVRKQHFNSDGTLKGLSDTSHRPSLYDADRTLTDALHYATDSDSESDNGGEGPSTR